MTLRPEEPAAGPWTAMPFPALVADLLRLAGNHPARPAILAVNGRSGSGKSTLGRRLAAEIPASHLLSTDDLCWWEPMFEWAHIPTDYVLEPLHRGEPVAFTPPAWTEHGREGQIQIPAGTKVLIMEGVGSDQAPFSHLIDIKLWVQADYGEAERRGLARDIEDGTNGDAEESLAFWRDWEKHEVAFYERDKPWERAALVVAGSEVIPLAEGEVAVARP